MAAPSDFKTLESGVQQALIQTTKATTALLAEDLDFHRSLDPTVTASLDRQNARLLSLAERLLANAAAGTEAVGPRLPDVDAVDSNWRGVVDVLDSLLEKADTNLDEYTGIVKRFSPGKEQSPAPASQESKPLYRNQDLVKPQGSFEVVPRNNETEAFKPLLTSKPHATLSLKESIRLETDKDGSKKYVHPYKTEIENYRYPTSVYTKAEPIPYTPFESTTATWVDTPEALATMLAELKTAKEIAVDLEHHDQRSYVGLLSLMQISTRDKDWIVDTLKPWRRRLECLNEVFTDPSIVKVLHGAHMDSVWLQRDLGLYVVGLFDTHHACKALSYPGRSLAFLLQKFINFTAQKQYQTADWRIRPLPQALFDYARSDTHFLLYIYDRIRNELIENSDFASCNPDDDLIDRVLKGSKGYVLQTYDHSFYDAERGLGQSGWYRLLSKNPTSFNAQQFSVFKAVHRWRDTVARQEDEGPHYIMDQHVIFSIAREMPWDRAVLFNIAGRISPVLRARADDLIAVIVRAKEAGKNGPEMTDVLAAIDKELYPNRYIPQILNDVAAAKEKAKEAAKSAPAATQTQSANGLTPARSLRSTVSTFFGNIFGHSSTKNDQHRDLSTSANPISLALPMPSLAAEVFTDPADLEKPGPIIPITDYPVTQNETKLSQGDKGSEDDIFTIGKKSRKRKRKYETGAQAEDETVALDDAGVLLAEQKAQRKAEKKAAKKAKRLAEKQTAADGTSSGGLPYNEGDDNEPFDYASAPSVLHAARENSGGKRDKAPKGFNPHAKAMDAPKGLGKRKDKAGRSKTFGK